MDEQPEAPVEEPTTPATPEEPQEGHPEPAAEDSRLKKARNEAQNLRERLKAAEQELGTLREAQMTEAEKAEARLKAAEEQVPTLLKRAVAAEAQLPAELAGRLVGETEEELVADAERLKALFSTAAAPSWGQQPGAWPAGPRGNPKAPTLPEQIAEAEAKGDYSLARTLKAQMVGQQQPVGA